MVSLNQLMLIEQDFIYETFTCITFTHFFTDWIFRVVVWRWVDVRSVCFSGWVVY